MMSRLVYGSVNAVSGIRTTVMFTDSSDCRVLTPALTFLMLCQTGRPPGLSAPAFLHFELDSIVIFLEGYVLTSRVFT